MKSQQSGEKGRYILLISIHGLIRGHDLELGRDADTGGQTKYVVDLARSMGEQPCVERVDLVTRLVKDPAVSQDYAKIEEKISSKANIVRIAAGPAEYIAKEQLWDHLDSFMDNLFRWLNEQPRMPDIIHSHYADAGYVGVKLSNLLGIPLIHTGHSLGRDKRKRLLARGLSRDEIEKTYNIARRIDAEEDVLANADLVVASTHNEIEEQYGLYSFYDPDRMAVIPPGTDLKQFHPVDESEDIPFQNQVARFFTDPSKPIILALSRPDERKNILTLIESFGESVLLQQHANLLIIVGNREDIRDLEKGAQTVLTNILLLIDSYDLYGRVAVPKKHRAEEVPQIYRMVAALGGIFINPALTEPFGLTLLEAAASGLPLVATENGGPVDIIANCQCGELVDPLDKDAITAALLKILQDKKVWNRYSKNGIKGVRKHYSWEAHAKKYLTRIGDIKGKFEPFPQLSDTKLSRYRDRAIFTDLDQNLIGNPEAMRELAEVLKSNRRSVSFGIATGRRIDSALALMTRHSIPRADVLISSLGTDIHYGAQLTQDKFWPDHIDHDWRPQRILSLLEGLPGLKKQPKKEQSQFKISYYFDQNKAPSVEEIITLLREKEVNANVMLSFGQFLDVVPTRASKGQALRYVAQLLDIPLEQTLVVGGSGTDEDMMRGNMLSVVVSNRHHEELSQLEEMDRIYFADQPHAYGILQAIEHYDFFNTCRVPDE